MASNDVPAPTAFRWAALCVVTLAVLAVTAGLAPWLSFIVKTGNPLDWGSTMPFAATAAFTLLCLANAWRARDGRGPLVSAAETGAVFMILLLGGWTTTWAFVDNAMPLLTSPWVFASPDNGWTEQILPHLPRWLMGPSEEPYASGFYNGLATGAAIPWGRWVVPILAWSAFAALLSLFAIGLAGLVSRQWIEHDRLTFPQAEILLSLTRGALTQRMFWWGVAFAAAIPAWNLFRRFAPIFPSASLYFSGDANGVEWFKGAQTIQAELKLGMLGLLYFVHRDIVASMCVFFFIVSLKNWAMGLAGFKLEHTDLYAGAGAVSNLQTEGALLALVCAGLWSARHSLRAYLRAALRGEDDDWSWLSPRATLLALAAGSAGVVGWMAVLGLRHPLALLVSLGTQGLGWLAVGRVAAESSIEVALPVDAVDMTALVAGTKALVPAGVAALAVSMCWLYGSSAYNQVTGAVEGERLRIGARYPRWLLWVLVGSAALATAMAMAGTTWTAYRFGANNFGTWEYQWQMRIPYDLATENARNPHGTDWARIGWLGIGAMVMAGLILLRNHVVGWFLHPVGFILASLGSGGGSPAHQYVFTGIFAWGLKTLILKLGGVEGYERYKPFFAGLVAGGFFPSAVQLLINVVYFLFKHRPLA